MCTIFKLVFLATLKIFYDGSVWLFDCGEGTQIQLQKVPVSRQKICKIFITHLHGDHLFGLPGLMCTISSQMGTLPEGKELPVVELYGPLGLQKFVYNTLSLSRCPLAFNFVINELVPITEQYPDNWDEWQVDHTPPDCNHPNQIETTLIKPNRNVKGNHTWKLIEDSEFVVEAGWISHRVPCFGYIIKERDKPGKLCVEKLKQLGLQPGPLCGELKRGYSVQTPSGATIHPSDVLGSDVPGRNVVILGDTCDASNMAHLVGSCDVLVHEATHDDSLDSKALDFGHSTPSQAVAMAVLFGAKTLILNHFSQRYLTSEEQGDTVEKESVNLLKEQAEDALEGRNIKVLCAEDLLEFEVKRK